jgi:hypothetical protein
VATAIAATAFAASATAGVAPSGCSGQVFEKPFQRWLDPFNYVLLPNGAFEAGATGWALRGSASIARGNEPFNVHGAGESRSLSLPSGSSATSSQICAKLLSPELRFFAVNRGSLLSTLKVEVLFPDLFGGTQALPILVPVLGTASWQPTLPLPFAINALALLSRDGSIPIAFRFTPQGTNGNWTIDDVYLDPYKGR